MLGYLTANAIESVTTDLFSTLWVGTLLEFTRPTAERTAFKIVIVGFGVRYCICK